jgi:hypothetical protein
VHVEITLSEWKTYSACENKTQCQSHNLEFLNHFRACQNYTQRFEIILLSKSLSVLKNNTCGFVLENKCIELKICEKTNTQKCKLNK